MSEIEKMKFKIWEHMFSKADAVVGVIIAIAVLFSVLAINKEDVFGYIRNAHELSFEEQMKFQLSGGGIQCGALNKTINSVVLIPERNKETGVTSRYLLIVNYTLTNISGEEQRFEIQCLETGKWNGEDCQVEIAGYVDLNDDFTAKKKDYGYIEGNETTEEYYYALWIYTDYDEEAYYFIPPLEQEKLLQIGIGLQTEEEEKFTIIGF